MPLSSRIEAKVLGVRSFQAMANVQWAVETERGAHARRVRPRYGSSECPEGSPLGSRAATGVRLGGSSRRNHPRGEHQRRAGRSGKPSALVTSPARTESKSAFAR